MRFLAGGRECIGFKVAAQKYCDFHSDSGAIIACIGLAFANIHSDISMKNLGALGIKDINANGFIPR